MGCVWLLVTPYDQALRYISAVDVLYIRGGYIIYQPMACCISRVGALYISRGLIIYQGWVHYISTVGLLYIRVWLGVYPPTLPHPP
ncbi:MAG: hypothetical protein V1709_07690, partial [Planctomycetota bacterium]